MTRFMRAAIFVVGLVAISMFSPATESLAQITPLQSEQAPKVDIEADQYGRDSPRGLVNGFLAALAAQDFDRASHYLDLRDLPEAQSGGRGQQLAGQLQRILDRRGQFLAFTDLSSDPSGHTNDDLGPDIDKIGTIRGEDDTIPIMATRLSEEGNPPAWVMSSETVQALPALARGLDASLIDKLVPQPLKQLTVFGAPAGHWIALAVFMVLALLTVALPAFVLIRYLDRLPDARQQKRSVMFVRASAMPAALMIATIAFMISAQFAGVSIVARGHAGRLSEILAWISFAWLLWRLIDGISRIAVARMSRAQRSEGYAAVGLFRRALKSLVVLVAVLAALDTVGLDMTTGIAALGIGGIALALGAQKTIENFVGSLTLVADQPVRVGDFCQFGDITGTVEDIGMRSTRVRTLSRTIVTVPNGEFSSIKIENFTLRDHFLLKHDLGLRYDTKPDQLAQVLSELRTMLAEDRRIVFDSARVRFIGFGADALILEVFAYVVAADWETFLEIQEEMNIRIMSIVAEAGADFAFPSRTIYFGDPVRDPRVSTETPLSVDTSGTAK